MYMQPVCMYVHHLYVCMCVCVYIYIYIYIVCICTTSVYVEHHLCVCIYTTCVCAYGGRRVSDTLPSFFADQFGRKICQIF